MVAEDQINMNGSESEGAYGAKDGLKREFARRLHQAMVAKDWRQADLHRASGVAKDSISSYYNAKILPTDYNLTKLARALGVTPGALMPGVSPDSPPMPEIETLAMWDVPGSAGLKRLRVNRIVSIGTAVKVIDMVNSDDADGE